MEITIVTNYKEYACHLIEWLKKEGLTFGTEGKFNWNGEPTRRQRKTKKGKEMLKDFWKRLKFLLTYKPKDAKKELPQIAIDCIKQFNDVFYQNSVSERVSWFGRQVERFIKEHPSAVKYEDGVLTIDVSVTACVPGDWGDEMFNAMYRTEVSLRLATELQMKCIPEDYHLPENVRSKEHFVAIRWKLSKKMTDGR